LTQRRKSAALGQEPAERLGCVMSLKSRRRAVWAGWLRVTTAAISLPGGVECSLTQKPWRPGAPSPGN